MARENRAYQPSEDKSQVKIESDPQNKTPKRYKPMGFGDRYEGRQPKSSSRGKEKRQEKNDSITEG
jgi:hypothetical protein